MIHANPSNGNASEDATAPEGYTLTFDTPEAYAAWLAANFPPQPAQPAPEPGAPTVPAAVTNAQFRAALIDRGILPAQIDAVIAQLPDPTARLKADQWWNFANLIDRDSVYVAAFAPVFGLSSADVDALFASAESQST